jgi:hypothetical protein
VCRVRVCLSLPPILNEVEDCVSVCVEMIVVVVGGCLELSIYVSVWTEDGWTDGGKCIPIKRFKNLLIRVYIIWCLMFA